MIYLATSWRNPRQPKAVRALRDAGFSTYDFRARAGFDWRDVHRELAGPAPPAAGTRVMIGGVTHPEPDFLDRLQDSMRQTQPRRLATGFMSAAELVAALAHPRARQAFETDLDALRLATVCVLLLPCGRSAHLEAGWLVGRGVPLVVVADKDSNEPELMYRFAAAVVASIEEAITSMREAGIG